MAENHSVIFFYVHMKTNNLSWIFMLYGIIKKQKNLWYE
jgi:hypothetical protein